MSGAEHMDGVGDVLEGFLCPICLEDLTSITQLQVHFEENHALEDKDVLLSLKGFLNKAKKKLMKEDEPDAPARREFDGGGLEYEPNNPWNWEPPPLGPSRSHTALFKKIRSARIDSFVAETNKLLIRLDKLLRDMPNDHVKRKVHERSIVMWADDKDVPLCPFCARTFNLARRRHHCRLCGGIMCDECSDYLTFDYAKKLISPVHQGNIGKEMAVATASGGGQVMSSIFAGLTSLRRSGSQGSLNSLLSVMDSMTAEQHLRVCQHCMTRLQARDNQVEQRTSRPTLSLYYEKLVEYRTTLEQQLPQYIQMAESLNSGESTFNLQDAEELRMKILKTGDNLNSMSQKIRNLGLSKRDDVPDGAGTEAPTLGPRQELLQRRIYSTHSSFLKEHILSLPKLPTPQEFKATQERRRLEAEARLAAEKEAMRQAEERATEILRKREKESWDTPRSTPNRSSSNTPSRSSSSTPVSFASIRKKQQDEVVVDTGWGTSNSQPSVTETDDPMIQQMNNIRSYIKQAREANRYDAVATLEANLKELQGEFRKQQKLMNP